MGDFSITAKQVPSTQLIEAAAALHIEPAKIMRDYYAVREADGIIRLVVGDMANNIRGTAVTIPGLAEWAGLPATMKLNGGLAGSLACKQQLISSRATGAELVKAAHAILTDTYKICGLQGVQDPAERFTGYFTHVQISPKHVTLTAVGDVFAWLNGKLVVGAEKQVDTEKALLVDAILDDIAAGKSQASQDPVEHFIRTARLDNKTAGALREQVADLAARPAAPGRQAAYKVVDRLITPWHIRHLQNKPAGAHPWAYGAIDGTETPAAFIQTVAVPTAELRTLVVSTDGSAPRQPGAAVRTIDDLQPINSEFSEQTIVALRRTGNN